jgi:hypothetical protein
MREPRGAAAGAADAMLFGYATDARPVSYSEVIRGNPTGRALGFCERLDDHLRDQGLELRACELPFDERFGVLDAALTGRAAILCGPDSLTPARHTALTRAESSFSAEVSRPFLATSIQRARQADQPVPEAQQLDRILARETVSIQQRDDLALARVALRVAGVPVRDG